MRVAPLCTGMSRKRNEKLSQSAVIKHFAKTRNSKEFFMYDQLLVKFTTHF